MEIPIRILSDEKGYFDRECPNEDCLYTFKVYMEDWENKVSDEEVHCPMCGHIDTSDKWWTQEQLDGMEEIVSSYALNYIETELDRTFGQLARSTRNNKFLKITYKPGRQTSFINNPIGQREEWETEIQCEKCGTRYSVIGSAFFCPCCGYNSAISAFNDSLDSIRKMIDSLPEMRSLLTTRYNKDSAETMCRGMLEGTIGDMVSAFQRNNSQSE
jgi:ribosomal protein L37E